MRFFKCKIINNTICCTSKIFFRSLSQLVDTLDSLKYKIYNQIKVNKVVQNLYLKKYLIIAILLIILKQYILKGNFLIY